MAGVLGAVEEEAVLAAASQEVAAVSAEAGAAVHGKSFSRFANCLLVFRVYLAYFCASLKAVHEKG